MTTELSISRRTALTTVTGTALTAIAGCLDHTPLGGSSDSSAPSDGTETLSTKMVDGGRLVVTLAEDVEVNRVNLIQPNGELYAKRDVAAGVSQVTFELGTTYQPGDYTILALNGDTTTAKTTHPIEPNLAITDVGLYRNSPDKPWDEVYGGSRTDTQKNGEAFVSVKNSGTGPDEAIELIFTGDVPNPLENPRGNGMYETKRERLPPGETVDLYSSSFPFGSTSEDGMGCSPSGNSGEFTVEITTTVGANTISKTYSVTYTGSDDMSDCTVKISES